MFKRIAWVFAFAMPWFGSLFIFVPMPYWSGSPPSSGIDLLSVWGLRVFLGLIPSNFFFFFFYRKPISRNLKSLSARISYFV